MFNVEKGNSEERESEYNPFFPLNLPLDFFFICHKFSLVILLSLVGGSSELDGDMFLACSCCWFSWGCVVQSGEAWHLGRGGFFGWLFLLLHHLAVVIWTHTPRLRFNIGEDVEAACAWNRLFLLSAFPAAWYNNSSISLGDMFVWMKGQKCLHIYRRDRILLWNMDILFGLSHRCEIRKFWGP